MILDSDDFSGTAFLDIDDDALLDAVDESEDDSVPVELLSPGTKERRKRLSGVWYS